MYVRTRVRSFNLLVSRSIVSVQYVCTVPGLCVHGCVCVFVCVRVFVCRWVCAPVYLHTYNMSENYVYTCVPRGAELHFACDAIFLPRHLAFFLISASRLSRSLSSLDVFCMLWLWGVLCWPRILWACSEQSPEFRASRGCCRLGNDWH